MNVPKNLTFGYIQAWCQEWNIDQSDLKLLIERYAVEDDDWALIDFMCDLAKERTCHLAQSGELVMLDEFLKAPRNWEYGYHTREI